MFVGCKSDSMVCSQVNIGFHQYADDCPIYVSSLADKVLTMIQRFVACLADVDEWTKASILRLNRAKMQVLWLGSSQQLLALQHIPGPHFVHLCHWCWCRLWSGWTINSQWSLSTHVAALIRKCYFHLQQIRPTIWSLTTKSTRTLVQAFIASHLNYCNLCFTAQLMDYFKGCNQSKMLLHISLLVQDGAKTSLRFSASYTGYRCSNISTLSSPASFIRRWPVKSWCTLPRTAVSYRTQICILWIPEYVLSCGQITVLVTGDFWLLIPTSGTVCQLCWKFPA